MSSLEQAWYNDAAWVKLLKPLSLLFKVVSEKRRKKYKQGRKQPYRSKLPVIVIGNITVGGTGKTPLVVYLAAQLSKAGYTPGIVSRGYKSKASHYPFVVTPNGNPKESGDEPLLLAKNTSCPVVIDSDRVAAIKKIEADFNCDVILSDDGLQHYAMGRDIEIAVIDGNRGFGNGLLLPAGPLRETVERLLDVDYLVSNGQPLLEADLELPKPAIPMKIIFKHLCNIHTGEVREIENKPHNRPKVHAVTGIGNPERFFGSLCQCGFDIISHVYPDHYAFTAEDIQFPDDLDVIMTEKDAIKCHDFVSDRHWYLKIEATLQQKFISSLLTKLETLKNPQAET